MSRRTIIVLGIAGCLGIGVAAAPVLLDGARFAWVVERLLPATRGRIRVGRASWTWGAAWSYLRGRPAPLAFEDVVITDPERTEVLRAQRLTGAIEIALRPRRVVIHDLRITGAVWRMARMKDGSGIGFLAASEPVSPSPAVARDSSPAHGHTRGPTFQLEDVRIEGLDAVFDLPGWALTLRDVHAVGHLGFRQDPERYPSFTFDLSEGDVRGGGQVVILDGLWRTVLPFTSARLAHVATTLAAPDAIAIDASAIATGRSLTSLHGAFTGIFGVGGLSKPAGLALSVAVSNAADALQAVAAARARAPQLGIAGSGASLALTFSGPMSAVTIDARARGFDVSHGALSGRDVGFHFEAQPTARHLVLDGLTFTSPAGGTVELDAQVDHLRASGVLTLHRFASGPYLPAFLRDAEGTLDGRVQAGVDFGAKTAAIDSVVLTISRPRGGEGPGVIHVLAGGAKPPPRGRGDTVLRLATARLAHGTLDLPRVVTSVAGGRVTAAGHLDLWDGTMSDWLPLPSFDMTLDASRVRFERLTGSSVATGQVSLRAHVAGRFDDMVLQIRPARHQSLRILGDSFVLPPVIRMAFAAGTFTLSPVSLHGENGGALAARGSVDLRGGLQLDVLATKFPLHGLASLVTGGRFDVSRVGGEATARLQLAGDRTAPVVTGALTLAGVRFGESSLGSGTLVITTGPRGEVRASGQVIDGVKVSGVLRGAGALNPRVELSLSLEHLRIDPFLEQLPLAGAATATGVVSGAITSRFTVGDDPQLDARLSEVALVVTPRPPPLSRTRTTRVALTPIEVRAAKEVHIVAAPVSGRVRMDPTRFSGTAADVEMEADVSKGILTGHARGQARLAPLAPFLPDRVEELEGSLNLDVAGGVDTNAVIRSLNGKASVATALRARFKDVPLPVDVRVPTGRIAFSENEATIEGVSLVLGRDSLKVSGRLARGIDGMPDVALDLRGALDARLVEPFAGGYVRDLEGSAQVTARIDGPGVRPTLRAHLTLGGIGFTLLPGANRVRVAGGSIDFSDLAVVVRALDLRIGSDSRVTIGADAGDPGRLRLQAGSLVVAELDLPARGTVRALATPAAIIDSASFGLRLTGAPPRLRLAGDMFIDAAHVPAELRNPKLASLQAHHGQAGSVLAAMRLDLGVRSQRRALTVEMSHAPELHAGLDYHIGGTVAAPEITGRLKPAGLYSTMAFFLAGLFR